VPNFASTDGPKSAIPIKNKRYQIPRYPDWLGGPMPADAQPELGTGMLVPWTRVSTILDTHEDKEGIFKWTKRLLVKGLGAREDLYALAAATRLEDKAGLLKIADQAFDYAKGQAASNLGTALHSFLERWVEGDKDLVIPAQWRGDVAAVMAAFQDANIRLRPDLQEMCVVRPDLKDGDAGGLAGRLDLVVEMLNPETGEWELILADYKTGSDPLAYGSWKIQQQLGLYGTAWAIWDGTHWRPMPKIRRDKILMVHVLPGQASCQIHVGDVDSEELEEDLKAAYRTRRRRKEAKKAWRPLVTVEDGAIVDAETIMGAGPVKTKDGLQQAAGVLDAPALGVPIGPTKPPVDAMTGWTPDQVAAKTEEAERAAATVARVAAESNPNLDDEEGPTTYRVDQDSPPSDKIRTITGRLDGDDELPRPTGEVPAFIRDGEGKPLAPLAGPGERGCGVCGRKGHRRGSSKCLGENDPGKGDLLGPLQASVDKARDQREANGGPTDAEIADGWSVPTEHCRCSTRSAGWRAPADGKGPWVCGDCGLPSKLGVPLAVQTGEQAIAGRPQVVEMVQDDVALPIGEQVEVGDPPAEPIREWSVEYGFEPVALDKLARNLLTKARAELEHGHETVGGRAILSGDEAQINDAWTPHSEDEPDERGTAEELHLAALLAGEMVRSERLAEPIRPGELHVGPMAITGTDRFTDDPDPFDEDGSDTLGPSWLEQIQQAPDKAALREIRAAALVADEWTQELTQAGLERIKVLAQQG
jgi:hypothetical protein